MTIDAILERAKAPSGITVIPSGRVSVESEPHRSKVCSPIVSRAGPSVTVANIWQLASAASYSVMIYGKAILSRLEQFDIPYSLMKTTFGSVILIRFCALENAYGSIMSSVFGAS
jgi:putative copper export protein